MGLLDWFSYLIFNNYFLGYAIVSCLFFEYCMHK